MPASSRPSRLLPGTGWLEQVERLAHHALRGEVWDKALAYCRQAGEKALAQSAHREAVGYFEQALSVLPHLPETARHAASRPLTSGLICMRRSCHLAILSVSWRRCARPRPSPRPWTTLVGWDRSLSRYHNHFFLRGAYEQSMVCAQRVLALATASGDRRPAGAGEPATSASPIGPRATIVGRSIA